MTASQGSTGGEPSAGRHAVAARFPRRGDGGGRAADCWGGGGTRAHAGGGGPRRPREEGGGGIVKVGEENSTPIEIYYEDHGPTNGRPVVLSQQQRGAKTQRKQFASFASLRL